MTELRLTADGERALREAENFCWHMNVAIEAPEHLLAGALVVLAEEGWTSLPPRESIEAALEMIVGRGSAGLTDNVMPGPAARVALNHAVRAVREAGHTTIDARAIAVGVIDSGELHPMFAGALGTTSDELRRRIASHRGKG
ncbi:MAG: hypothetical protein Kow0010_06720 [Dehalococcoidia bacterium]